MRLREAVRTCLKPYARFRGRASRSEFWYFTLFVCFGLMVASIIDGALFRSGIGVAPVGPVTGLFGAAMFLPFLAAGWRRMQDTGRRGLYILYPLIVSAGIGSFVGLMAQSGALLGRDAASTIEAVGGLFILIGMFVLAISPLIVIWWLTRRSQPGENSWGPPPA